MSKKDNIPNKVAVSASSPMIGSTARRDWVRFFRSEKITPIFIYLLDGSVASLTIAEAKQLHRQLAEEIETAEKQG